jgi:hypothetical protein
MTVAELRVLEARMDMLDAVLQDLIEQLRRAQASGWTGQSRQAVSGLPGVLVVQGFLVQGFLQVVADGFEDRAARELVGLGEADPTHLG